MKRILYLTDFAYQAKGRRYCDEDIVITDYLRSRFNVACCHPTCCEPFEDTADVMVFRNAGAVSAYQEAYDALKERIHTKHLVTFNEFSGKADMAGKDYLLDMTAHGLPVIPTVDSKDDLAQLPQADRYVVKPKTGADSNGLEFLSPTQLDAYPLTGRQMLIQPAIDFTYEVSFYFINDTYEYALYAPDTQARWELVPYQATAADVAFARTFIAWNDMGHGIQRVDVCRTRDRRLLLVELEELDRYLSLDRVSTSVRTHFMEDFTDALDALPSRP